MHALITHDSNFHYMQLKYVFLEGSEAVTDVSPLAAVNNKEPEEIVSFINSERMFDVVATMSTKGKLLRTLQLAFVAQLIVFIYYYIL